MTIMMFIRCEIPSHYGCSNTLPVEEQPVWNIVSQEVSHRIWTGGEATVIDEKTIASGLTLRDAEEMLKSILASPAQTSATDCSAMIPNAAAGCYHPRLESRFDGGTRYVFCPDCGFRDLAWPHHLQRIADRQPTIDCDTSLDPFPSTTADPRWTAVSPYEFPTTAGDTP
jgi:hypothetical protein